MKKVFAILLVVLLGVTAVFANGGSDSSVYPSKDINVYIFSSQGGGTDVWVRFLAPLMEEKLGVSVICSNLPGANGGTAAQKVWNSPHDGYNILGASETAMFFGANDLAPTAENWDFYIAAGSGGVICVPANSKYQTIEDLVAAAKANPGSVTIANSGQGKGWHLKAVILENAAGCEFKHVPYNGSSPAITATLSGETDAVSCSTGEIMEYIRGGLMRPLVITEDYPWTFEGYDKEVPAATELYPESASDFANFFQWLGFMLPKDTPENVKATWKAAFDAAVNDPRTAEFAATQAAEVFALSGEEADKMAGDMEAMAWWLSQDLGVAKVNPESAGIARP